MKKRYCFIARSDLFAEGGLVECLKPYLLFVIPYSDPESKKEIWLENLNFFQFYETHPAVDLFKEDHLFHFRKVACA